MKDPGHDHCNHDQGEPISRRNAAKHALGILVAAGAAVLGLMASTGKAKAGYGACTINGCPCLGFQGNGEVCTNCGHLYTWHM